MPIKTRELGALAVSRLKEPGRHAVGGVGGLYLVVDKERGARQWVLRVTIGGRRRDMGFGGFPDVPLAHARDAARKARARIREGFDPIEEGKAARRALISAQAATKTFDQCAARYIKAKSPEWRSDKHAAQWASTLTTYASPVIGSIPVRDVGVDHVLAIVEPIWLTKTETATRVRNRLEAILNWAEGRGFRSGPNPARWAGNLQAMLAAPRKASKVVHHASLPVGELPGFMRALRAAEGQGARALEFAILTAARSGEVRGATWAEINLDSAMWTVPADRTKGAREHRVALSGQAVALLRAVPAGNAEALVFPSASGKPLSDMTLAAVLRRMKLDVVPHGFRATFKTWASETTNFPREVVEGALAHAGGDKLEAAYNRGDLFGKRAALMGAWGDYCASDAVNMTPLGKGSADA